MKLKLIGCEVLFREICDAVARAPHQVDIEFLPKGLHDLGGKPMAAEIQKIVDRVLPGAYDAILLGYGLCGNGLCGVSSREIPLVLPRAHDCIALLMGSRRKYLEYFNGNPGTYYRSTGWLERGKDLQQLTHSTVGMEVSLERMIAKYGEDNGRYVFEELTRYRRQYQRLAYIETGLEPDGRFIDEARREAAGRGWNFAVLTGNLVLLRRLVDGDWSDSDFLVLQPGQAIAASFNDDIVRIDTL